MDFKVYCDESGLEALTRKEAHLYTAIGGIWMPADLFIYFFNTAELLGKVNCT